MNRRILIARTCHVPFRKPTVADIVAYFYSRTRPVAVGASTNSSRATTARNFKRRPTLRNTNKAHLVRASLPQETRVPKKPRRRCLSPNESFPLFPSLSTDSESLRTGMETVSTRPHSHPASVGEPGDVHEWPRHLPSSSSAVQAALITRR